MSTDVVKGSVNVFADLGFPNAEEHCAKADLVIRVANIIAAQNITQSEAAQRIGVSQPEISKILNGHFQNYSLERLILFLRKLGSDVTIKVASPKKKREIGHLAILGSYRSASSPAQPSGWRDATATNRMKIGAKREKSPSMGARAPQAKRQGRRSGKSA